MLFVIACIYHFLESKIDVENLTTSYFTRLIKALGNICDDVRKNLGQLRKILRCFENWAMEKPAWNEGLIVPTSEVNKTLWRIFSMTPVISQVVAGTEPGLPVLRFIAITTEPWLLRRLRNTVYVH